jgi:transposase InsO family protein
MPWLTLRQALQDRVVRQRGLRHALEDIYFAVFKLARWLNHHRLLEPLRYLLPAEYEEAFHGRREAQALGAVLS